MCQVQVCFRIFCLKEASSMEYCFLQDIFCSRWSFIWQSVLPCFFPRLHAVSPDHSDGAERPDHSSVWLFPAFYMLWHFCSAFVSQECAGKSKEGTDFYYGSRSFSERFSVQLEIILVIIGCILESYANPVLMEEVLKLFA